jgi:oligoribonuclease NrnB/cAMP/cGMP phosphodiesterase (DHH superfamily)
MKTLCVHHNDVDGCASAAIVRRALGSQISMQEINYGDLVPWEIVAEMDRVVIVDFSLPRSEMQRIAQGRDLIWIDHHISALEELAGLSPSWPGLRDTGEAACVLTWRYFFPEIPLPRAVVLIGDRDVWRWAEEDTGSFDEGLHQKDTDPENDALWRPLLDDDPQAVSQLIAQGSVLREARLRAIHLEVDRYGFPATFEGYSTLVINRRGNGDLGETIRQSGYELAYCYVDNFQNGKLMTFVTLYSSDVDVSEIARKFGGGGHPGASGFSFERGAFPFPPGAEFSWQITS